MGRALPPGLTPRQRRNFGRFYGYVDSSPQFKAVFDAIPAKRVIAACIICDSDEFIGVNMFQPHDPSHMPFLEGRTVFYGFCAEHNPPDLYHVEDRIHEIHGIK
jgi:hypothetical protein